MWDDFDPLLDAVADSLRPSAGVLPDRPSPEEEAALRAAVGQRFPRGTFRVVGGRHPLPMAIGVAAAAVLLSTAGVAAAATSAVAPLRLAQTVAHEIGLPVADPNVSDARSTLHQLVVADEHHDTKAAVRQMTKLRAELGDLESGDRSALMKQISANTPGIAAQLSNAPAPAGSNPLTAILSAGTTPPTAALTTPGTDTTLPTGPPVVVPPNTTPSSAPPPTVTPDTTPLTDPATTVPDTTPPSTLPPDTTPSTTVPPDTTPSTTVPPDTTPSTAPATTAPPDTSTTTTIVNQPQADTTTTTLPPDTTTTTLAP